MWLRRAFFGWLFPAAFLLPLWLFLGWGIFGGGALALIWVMFLAIPTVFIGQLVLTFLVRARPSVRASRAVSWWDVAGFATWHSLTIALAFFGEPWWTAVFVVTIVVALTLFWLEVGQLINEARSGTVLMRASNGVGYLRPQQAPSSEPSSSAGVYVINEDAARGS